MQSQGKYQFTSVYPKWVQKISDEQLVTISIDNAQGREMKEKGRGLCYISENIVRTSNIENSEYSLVSWTIHDTKLLQSASVREILLQENDSINIYRLVVIRNGVIVNKKEDATIRLLDEEQSSHQGSIHKTKKLHIVLSDLRIDDILVFEYSITRVFGEKHQIDRNYYRYIHKLPIVGYWFYQKYNFTFIQDRNEEVILKHKYFRDEKGEKDYKENIVIEKGGTFVFAKENFNFLTNEDVFNPYFEITIQATWKDISTYISNLYTTYLKEDCLKQSEIFKKLNLHSDENISQKTRKIIEYVQNQIVYLYDAEIMHSHIPQSAEKTMDLKSGDCKAKTYLLIKLLEIIGVKADFVLVNYGSDFYIPEFAPSPFVFNHVIAKVTVDEKIYFVDSTWSARYGTLENRAEPFFTNYLPILEGASLDTKFERSTEDLAREEDIKIFLTDETGKMISETLCRRENADSIREFFKKNDTHKLIQGKDDVVFKCLSFRQDKENKMADVLANSSYVILKDDIDLNEIIVKYETDLPKPYQMIDDQRIFKYYNYISAKNIINHNHKDSPCFGVNSLPVKMKLFIESDYYINSSEKVTTKDIVIDNAYFSFKNIKSVSSKSIGVTAEYLPKMYGAVKPEDLDSIKKDYITINSNFGVGIIFLSLGKYLFKNRILIVAFIILLRYILEFMS